MLLNIQICCDITQTIASIYAVPPCAAAAGLSLPTPCWIICIKEDCPQRPEGLQLDQERWGLRREQFKLKEMNAAVTEGRKGKRRSTGIWCSGTKCDSLIPNSVIPCLWCINFCFELIYHWSMAVFKMAVLVLMNNIKKRHMILDKVHG